MADRPLWIFGYGSLIWRPAFPFVERVDGRVEGWARRFWQGSTDHRGVPGAPGRVVTLVADGREHVWGRVFRVDPAARDEVLAQLDHREKGGYERALVQVVTREGGVIREVLSYHAGPGNPEYLGDAPAEKIAAQILRSAGPSGPNTDYLLNLADALRGMNAPDPHVEELATLVRRGLKSKG